MKNATAACIAVALVLALAPRALFAQDGPAGTWDLSVVTPLGPNTATLTLTQEGEALTGTLASDMGLVPISGTFSGGAVALSAATGMQGVALTISVHGMLVGDALSGAVRFGDFGEFPFTGKRGTGTPPPAAATAASPSIAPESSASAAADASGKWSVLLTVPGLGDLLGTATLQQEGNKVTGVLSNQMGELKVSGTMTGTSLKLDLVAETPLGTIPIAMSGELTADGFTGRATVAGMGEAGWKATREK